MSAFIALVLLAAATSAAQPAATAPRLGEACTGTEVIRWGSQPPKTVPYALTFYVDLGRKSYCYGACEEGQSFAISDAKSRPIRLADMEGAGQVHHLTFDPATSSVSDFQIIDVGMVKVSRRASGVCTPVVFRAPWSARRPPAG